MASPGRGPDRVPDHVTHYFPVDDGPFRNLSDIGEVQGRELIAKLALRRAGNPGFKRVFGPSYLALRKQTEAKMRGLLASMGRKPDRPAPHYFVLGQSQWFAGLYPAAGEVVLPIANLPLDQTTFTYPDSMIAMGLGEAFGMPPRPRRPYHDQLFWLTDLPRIVHEFGLPRDGETANYDGYHATSFEYYIEVQVWTDDPVRSFLQHAGRRENASSAQTTAR